MREIVFNCFELVCPKTITFKIEDDTIYDIRYRGGCQGNVKALAQLCNGMSVDWVQSKLRGITCGAKGTSCANELVRAIDAYRAASLKE